MSSNNPFRTPLVSPMPTGASVSASTSTPAEPSTYYPPPEHQPPTTNSTGSSTQPLEIDTQLLSQPLTIEDAPPAYTPAPDITVGETTVDIGPRRPFQQPPQLSVQPYFSPQPTGGSSFGWGPPPSHPLSANANLNGTGTYPGRAAQSRSSLTPPLPPRPRTRSSSPPLSDFAREFYAAGAGVPPSEEGRNNARPRYAPPPGEPPARQPSSNSANARGERNDGRPTRTPVPGHPLLNNGRLLVYPAGFECHKCERTVSDSF
ncbi:hypothetical protein EW146_g2155 [Bondarzewia mesenterica]|uniref:Uncharacterized protein n=1 Tax=Bondarzewia mesenterica TaxID=1095465 RepID=A0A4S4M1R9_9AGAM|nr:hypothetical protein EW146_g2155 [Bondarzewia mesenterica]